MEVGFLSDSVHRPVFREGSETLKTEVNEAMHPNCVPLNRSEEHMHQFRAAHTWECLPCCGGYCTVRPKSSELF